MGATHEAEAGGTTRHVAHQWDGETTVTDTVVGTIAESTGADRESLPPIERSINPAALDSLFETDSDVGCLGGCVTFSYYRHTVVVQSTGQILIREDCTE